MSDWHLLDAAEVASRLGSSRTQGLTQAEADSRLRQHGPNALVERGAKSPWLILWDQLTSVMVIVLIVAGVISLALGEYIDAGAIFAIVVLNAVLGFIQEHRAERAMHALRQLAVPRVRVRRDGRVQEVSARSLVPGDAVLLEAGSLVPADGRLIEAVNLRVEEAALTGESEPVDKTQERVQGVKGSRVQGSGPPSPVPLAERRNMAYMGTAVAAGRGVMVVTETGMRTELGRIADMIQTVKREPTPLQRRLEQLARGLALAALVVVAVVFALGMARGEGFRLMFMVAISMAVAAVPEGLPAVVTIALTLGARRMLARKALIRRLAAVETLGSVTYICSDKTGTLTENRMAVTVLDVAGQRLDVAPDTSLSESVLACDRAPALALLLAGGALCNDATVETGSDGRARVIGDPTEGALVVAAGRFGLDKRQVDSVLARVAEIPFSSERKRMTTIHRKGDLTAGAAGDCLGQALAAAGLDAGLVAFTKGAVDVVLGLSGSVLAGRSTEPLTDEWRGRIEAANDRLAQSGMRVLGLAVRALERAERQEESGVERDLVFVGLTAMIDPARPEVREAVATCRTAGIVPVMITGDHPLTAQYIASELGILALDPLNPRPLEPSSVLTGHELAHMSAADLGPVVGETRVYARVAPEHKLAIVRALQKKGHVVAMTGDGVNDAPALKQADIGVAMGITGTDVAKEASDMVLLDDNFATIVAAVREGRAIYDNIRKFIRYILSANAGEIWVMLLAPFLGMPLPLLPLQILWINLVTDGLPGLALSFEPAERDVMKRPPRNPRENIFGQGLGWYIVWVGLLMAVLALGMGFWAWRAKDPGWQTMVFVVVTMSQLFQSLAVRSGRESLFRLGLRTNPWLSWTVLLTLALQLVVIYVPFMQTVFRTVPLSLRDLGISLALSTGVFWAVELSKLVLRRRALK